MPSCKPCGSVAAEYQRQVVCTETLERVDGVGPSLAIDLTSVRFEVGHSGYRELGHRPAVVGGRDVAFCLLPWIACGDERDDVYAELAIRRFAGEEMGEMGRVEGAAEDGASHSSEDRGWSSDASPRRVAGSAAMASDRGRYHPP